MTIETVSDLSRAATPLLYQHDDGRNLVTTAGSKSVEGDPGWHRVGPVTVEPFAVRRIHFDRAAPIEQRVRRNARLPQNVTRLVSQDAIATLEEALARARRGEFLTVMFAYDTASTCKFGKETGAKRCAIAVSGRDQQEFTWLEQLGIDLQWAVYRQRIRGETKADTHRSMDQG